MKIGTFITPNIKGQVVIPIKIREKLGISADTPLEVTLMGGGVVLYPVKVLRQSGSVNESYTGVLQKTAGSWSGDDWDKTQKERRQIELEESTKRKQAW